MESKKMKHLLIITEIDNIRDIKKKLSDSFSITYIPGASPESLSSLGKKKRSTIDSIFTNPNNSLIKLNEKTLNFFDNLKVICTASTGTVHINKDECKRRNIDIISLKNEISTLENVSSTAELAFLMMLSSIRNFIPAINDVKFKNWDCEKFLGRQLDHLKIGIIGFGRLGKMFAKYSEVFGAEIMIYDPYIKKEIIDETPFNVAYNLEEISKFSDIISLHVHVNESSSKFINKDFLKTCNSNVTIINTSRGEIVDEYEMIKFLDINKEAKYFTDVISDEIEKKDENLILQAYNKNKYMDRLIITPHIGGMTHDARFLAYNRAADLLIEYFKM